MFNAVIYLRTFGVVEAVECAHQVPGDTPDTLKAYAITDSILWYGRP